MLFGVNVLESRLHEAMRVLNCKHEHLSFLYLELPIGEDSRKLNFWHLLIYRIKRRVSGWKIHFLSMRDQLGN